MKLNKIACFKLLETGILVLKCISAPLSETKCSCIMQINPKCISKYYKDISSYLFVIPYSSCLHLSFSVLPFYLPLSPLLFLSLSLSLFSYINIHVCMYACICAQVCERERVYVYVCACVYSRTWHFSSTS